MTKSNSLDFQNAVASVNNLKDGELSRKLVEDFFYKAYNITIFWISILCVVLFLQFFLPECSYNFQNTPYSLCGLRLSSLSFSVLFGSTTAIIIGLWGTSGYLLFKNR